MRDQLTGELVVLSLAAGHGHPHLPKNQIHGINGVLSSIDAPLFDEVLQLYYDTLSWLDSV